ncbi:MAG: hypothetical protein KDA29_04215 [Phycisphaerales bacterium]|nr:hypothetical protein [Phycisphaerales bacterium]
MSTNTPWDDEYTLLCEKCGYRLEGLDTDGLCPECGLAIRESFPERRRTFEWLGYTRPRDLIRMAEMTLFRPAELFGHMRIEEGVSSDLRSYWFLVAIALIMLGYIVTPGDDVWWFRALISPIFIVIYLYMLFYNWLVRVMFEFIARRCGKRMDRELAGTITNYASFAWIGFAIVILVVFPAKGIAETGGHLRLAEVIEWIGACGMLAVVGYMIFLLVLGCKHAGYANRVRR